MLSINPYTLKKSAMMLVCSKESEGRRFLQPQTQSGDDVSPTISSSRCIVVGCPQLCVGKMRQRRENQEEPATVRWSGSILVLSCSAEVGSTPAMVSAGSTIDQMINAERLLQASVKDVKHQLCVGKMRQRRENQEEPATVRWSGSILVLSIGRMWGLCEGGISLSC